MSHHATRGGTGFFVPVLSATETRGRVIDIGVRYVKRLGNDSVATQGNGAKTQTNEYKVEGLKREVLRENP